MFRKILFCADFSANSDRAFYYALNLAKMYGATLIVLHVVVERTFYYWSSPESRDERQAKVIEFERKKALDRYGPVLGDFTDCEFLCCEAGEGEAQNEIIQAAQKQAVDVIVMGTHGRTGWNRLALGTTADYVVKHAPCPVLIVTPPKEYPSEA